MAEPPGKKSHKSASTLSKDDSNSETTSVINISRRKFRKSKRFRGGTHMITKPQWIPQDDYLLINCVVQLCDLLEVYEQAKFSKHYSFRAIESRWKDLLTSDTKSSVALEAITKLTEFERMSLDRCVPMNEQERNLISTVAYKDVFETNQSPISTTGASLRPFCSLLEKKRTEFFRFRTAEDLYECWNKMRKYGLIYPDPIFNFSKRGFDLEEFEYQMVTNKQEMSCKSLRSRASCLSSVGRCGVVSETAGSDLDSSTATVGDQQEPSEVVLAALLVEKMKQRRRLLRRIRLTGEEAHRWTALVDFQLKQTLLDLQHENVYAVLSGLMSRFLIKSRHTTFGRSTETIQPDINLSCESHNQRISCIQGYFRVSPENHFFIGNSGRRIPIWVNGICLLPGEETHLPDNSMIQLERLSFRFLVNPACADLEDRRPLFPRSQHQLLVTGGPAMFYNPVDPRQTVSTYSQLKALQQHQSNGNSASVNSSSAVVPPTSVAAIPTTTSMSGISTTTVASDLRLPFNSSAQRRASLSGSCLPDLQSSSNMLGVGHKSKEVVLQGVGNKSKEVVLQGAGCKSKEVAPQGGSGLYATAAAVFSPNFKASRISNSSQNNVTSGGVRTTLDRLILTGQCAGSAGRASPKRLCVEGVGMGSRMGVVNSGISYLQGTSVGGASSGGTTRTSKPSSPGVPIGTSIVASGYQEVWLRSPMSPASYGRPFVPGGGGGNHLLGGGAGSVYPVAGSQPAPRGNLPQQVCTVSESRRKQKLV